MRRICDKCGNNHDDEIHSTICPHNGIGFCRKCDSVFCVCDPKPARYEIFELGGNCPVQAEGLIDGKPFYFRARGEAWSFAVAAETNGDPLDVYLMDDDTVKTSGCFYYQEAYRTTDPFAAGWMEQSEARAFIAKAALLYAQREVK